jgi:hypothetical protein
MGDWSDNEYVAEYGNFFIENEVNRYKLEINGYIETMNDKRINAGDSLGDNNNKGGMSAQTMHNHMPFSTFDSDNDNRFYDNCAQTFKSGWWFNSCFQANLNGIYYHYTNTPDGSISVSSNGMEKRNSHKRARSQEHARLRFLRNGIHWNSIDFYKSLKTTKMRIKRRGL